MQKTIHFLLNGFVGALLGAVVTGAGTYLSFRLQEKQIVSIAQYESLRDQAGRDRERVEALSGELQIMTKAQQSVAGTQTLIHELKADNSQLKADLAIPHQRFEQLKASQSSISSRATEERSPTNSPSSSPSGANAGGASSISSKLDTDPKRTLLPSTKPFFETSQFRASVVGVRLADNRKSTRISIEIRNSTTAVLYLADHAYESEIASTEGGDLFDDIRIIGLKRIGSLRQDTFEEAKNYTAIPQNSAISIVWEISVKQGEPPIQGKFMSLRNELLWLSDSGPKRIPFQLSSIPL